MKPFGISGPGLLGAVAITVFVAPSAKAGAIGTQGAGANGGSGGSTGVLDLGTIVYAININASIFNSVSNQPQTYTYNQLLQGGNNLDMLLDSGFTVAQELTALGYAANPGILNYNFPFSGGASGSYTQSGPSPPFPPTSEFPGTVSLTASAVSGNVCSGFNSIGATINVDPTNAASTYDTILGCAAFSNPNNGFPASTTTTVTVMLGTVTSSSATSAGDTTNVTVIEGEAATTTWESSGTVNAAAATPEPSSAWLELAGIAGLCALRDRRRRRA